MNKQQFLDALHQGLKKHHVNDIDDIINEYHEFFHIQLEKGKKEDDVALMLGDVTSIISDYAGISKRSTKTWFDLVAIGLVAIPLLILGYGLWVVLVATSLSFWGISIYYLFDLDSLSFMPFIPKGVHLFYVLTSLSYTLMFFGLSVRLWVTLKSMMTQFLAKQSIRIGEYQMKKIYVVLLKYSFFIGIGLLAITYIVSWLVAKNPEYWHVWKWFM
jgi:uncharacterized membrane protein